MIRITQSLSVGWFALAALNNHNEVYGQNLDQITLLTKPNRRAKHSTPGMRYVQSLWRHRGTWHMTVVANANCLKYSCIFLH